MADPGLGYEEDAIPPNVYLRPWECATPPFCIVGNLYYVGNTSVSSHLIDTGDGLILLDTTFPQTVYLLLESIRRLGFDPDALRYILHCRGHYDHFGGTRTIVELTGAKTVMGEQDIEIIESSAELYWAPEYGVEFHETFAVDVPLSEGGTLCLGNTSSDTCTSRATRPVQCPISGKWRLRDRAMQWHPRRTWTEHADGGLSCPVRSPIEQAETVCDILSPLKRGASADR